MKHETEAIVEAVDVFLGGKLKVKALTDEGYHFVYELPIDLDGKDPDNVDRDGRPTLVEEGFVTEPPINVGDRIVITIESEGGK